jgi:ArsR family transcriptional regulator, arsenate/arsenite/antimonite-responsive transcriptional repressor
MQQPVAIDAFSALAHETRLSVFRLLVKEGPGGTPALEIARRLQVKPSTLSGHLAILKQAGLVLATRRQREIRYAANIRSVNDLVVFLMEDCCGEGCDAVAGFPACAGNEVPPDS